MWLPGLSIDLVPGEALSCSLCDLRLVGNECDPQCDPFAVESCKISLNYWVFAKPGMLYVLVIFETTRNTYVQGYGRKAADK